MVEFETIKAEEVKFGRNNFIEISRKKAVTDNNETEFISIARGFYLADGEKDGNHPLHYHLKMKT